MVAAEPRHVRNPNPAVRCAWQGDPEKKIRFDWAPPEVRVKSAPNFELPAFSFDIFSFGVLLLKLLNGRTWTQDVLRHGTFARQLQAIRTQVEALGLTADLVVRMLDHDRPAERPLPRQVLQALNDNRRSCATGISAASSAATDLPVPSRGSLSSRGT